MQKSKHYFFIDAVNKRLNPDDLEVTTFQQKLYRLNAGLAGEEKLKRVISDYNLRSKGRIYYNFECVNASGYTHQIDGLLVTAHFIVIFEVKQISGTLFYKPALHEFYRVSESNLQENFPNPFDQAYRHQLFIEYLLKTWQISIPVYYMVVIANIRAKLDSSLMDYPIMHISGVPYYLEKLYEQHPKPQANLSILQNHFALLYKQLPPRRTIEKHRLRKGVLCKQCQYLNVMYYKQGYFECSICQTKNKDAIIESLVHYRILISPRITNKEFREFFNIPCIHTASKMLRKLGLEKHGTNKGAFYIIPDSW
ncbi:NERD domain-containing protein [Solibacillus sp. MA9]|uniref:NERD domain-containing protein n=1 Tax=Solibacillus palustris TaxID=2908203 RepID=A0ABS9UFH0_9BACL|nr:nuclease-related domain-containing protein [Solibacillus sp. MA9]MCH7322890.1 NERD domain-containing protein [Solibacillus sp. MA9]